MNTRYSPWLRKRVMAKNHKNSTCDGRILEGRLVAATVFGKPLPHGCVVHHVNGDPSDNKHKNLVILENQSIHRLIHSRMEAYFASGSVYAKHCSLCDGWYHKDELCGFYCRPCERQRSKERRAARTDEQKGRERAYQREYQRLWRINNPEIARERDRQRYQRRKGRCLESRIKTGRAEDCLGQPR